MIEASSSEERLFWTAIVLAFSLVGLLSVLRWRRKPRLPLPPGPRPWPVLGNLLGMESSSHQGFAKLSKQYGPLILLRLGSVPLVVANNAKFAKEILKTNNPVFAARPRIKQFVELAYNNQTISSAPNGPMRRNMVKILKQELMTSERMAVFQPTRREELLTAVHVLLYESEGVKAVRVNTRLKEHLGNIVTRMMVSKRFFGPRVENPTDSARYQAAIRDFLDLLGVFHLGDYIPLFKHWDVQGHSKRMTATRERLDGFFQSILDERRRELDSPGPAPQRGDFLDAMLTRSGSDDEVPLTQDMIKGIFQDVLVGGVDSSAGVVEWAIAELLRNPHVHKKAQEELDAEVGRERLLEESDIPRLPYMYAIVKEVLRLHPVTPLLIPYVSVEPCDMGGFHIPTGTQAMVNTWAIGRDPESWDKPEEFYPERFLDSSIDPLGQYFELLPFGSGRRICPGAHLGLLLASYFLAFLVHATEWTLPEGQTVETVDMTEGVGIVSHMAVPVHMILSPRLARHVIYPPAAA